MGLEILSLIQGTQQQDPFPGGGNKKSSLRWAQGPKEVGLSFFLEDETSGFQVSFVPICQNGGQTSVTAYKSPSFCKPLQSYMGRILLPGEIFLHFRPENLKALQQQFSVRFLSW